MRISTGLSGLERTAHHSLMRAYRGLQESNVRLSTMRQINRGSDNPAGLIAAEKLKSELTAIAEASSNASRAVGMIHVADSGLSQVTGLLNTIRGNVVSAAGGILSDEEVAALQVENDAGLEAINRIGSYTSFGGRKLLNGGGDYRVTGVSQEQVTDIKIHAASGGTRTLNMEVTQAATQARLTFTDADAALDADVTLQIAGDRGAATLQLGAATTLDQVAEAVNASSENTGVAASVDGSELTFVSTAYGSDATVSIAAIEGTFDVGSSTSASGTDVVVNADGVEISGSGNAVAISTETLQVDVMFAEGFSGQVEPIAISESAMAFLFSPNVGQTSTLSLPTISTSALGGAAGRLSALRSGGSSNLATGNHQDAIAILDAARDEVVAARARAGAFEKYTIEATQRVLGAMEESLTASVSQILDTDVASETARWYRAQFLVQSSMTSLLTANSGRSYLGNLWG